jgi:hypothetical protein
LPKTLAQQLVDYHEKFNGTLRDRDYDLTKRGSGKENTRYLASPDAPSKMKLERFDSKKIDLKATLQSMVDGDFDEPEDEDDEPKKKKKSKGSKPKKTKEKNPWEDDDEPPKRKKSASKSKPAPKRSVPKRSVPKKRTVSRSR